MKRGVFELTNSKGLEFYGENFISFRSELFWMCIESIICSSRIYLYLLKREMIARKPAFHKSVLKRYISSIGLYIDVLVKEYQHGEYHILGGSSSCQVQAIGYKFQEYKRLTEEYCQLMRGLDYSLLQKFIFNFFFLSYQ